MSKTIVNGAIAEQTQTLRQEASYQHDENGFKVLSVDFCFI